LNPGQALVKVWPGFLVSGLDTVDATIADQPESEQHLQLALASAERKLAEARLQIAELEALLDEIPEIFERKFQQRLATVMEHQKHLLADNQALRDRLYSLNPAAADEPPPGSGRPQPLLLPTVARKQGWGQALKRALRLGGEGAPQKISRHDDGRPITA
jgi:hypothetical protein